MNRVPLTSRTTSVFSLSIIFLLLVYEGFSLLGQDATLSQWVWGMSQSPTFVFACGFLAGHFFWQRSHCANCGKSPIRRE